MVYGTEIRFGIAGYAAYVRHQKRHDSRTPQGHVTGSHESIASVITATGNDGNSLAARVT